MKEKLILILFLLLMFNSSVQATEKLVLDMDGDSNLISMAHSIKGYLFKPTMNFSAELAGNLSDRINVEPLKNHLVATALVMINGEIAGICTKQERLTVDQESGRTLIESAWLFSLNYPGATGVIAVKQQEDLTETIDLVNQVMQDPEVDWKDEFQPVLSSLNAPRVQLATGDLSVYQGGRFEEYGAINPADLRNYQRFRAKVRFVIYPAE